MATTAREWKGKLAKELPLPSGNTALVKRVSLDVLLSTGKVPNSLMAIMKDAAVGKNPDVEALRNADVDQITDMFRMFDTVVISCVIDPQVLQVPADGEPRDSEALYIDEVDSEDKQFIFQWAVGGTSDVEKFRTGQADVLDALQAGKGSGNSTEPTTVDL